MAIEIYEDDSRDNLISVEQYSLPTNITFSFTSQNDSTYLQFANKYSVMPFQHKEHKKHFLLVTSLGELYEIIINDYKDIEVYTSEKVFVTLFGTSFYYIQFIALFLLTFLLTKFRKTDAFLTPLIFQIVCFMVLFILFFI